MFTKILQWIKGVLFRMLGTSTVKQALNVDIAISSDMVNALQLWTQMYENKAPWLSKDIKSLNLPAAIASEIARAVTIEMRVDVSGSPRADFLNAQLAPVIDKLREQVEKCCAKGGMMMKPYVRNGEIDVDFIQADQFFPVSFDNKGKITSAVFVDQRTVGQDYYTRLEAHAITPQGCLIRNLAYKSTTRDFLGSPVPLTAVSDWADLQPEALITGIDRPLFAYFRYPMANNIDANSPLGVSCYSRAASGDTCLIQQADEQWSNLLWEFESGQRALYADVLAFEKKTDGTVILPQKRLYRALNGSSNIGDNPEGLFHEWTPTLREQNILNGLDAILRKIEFACGLAYGTLSNPATVDKTATELKMSNQRSYATISDTQKALKNALDDLLYAMDIWATLDKLAPKGTYSAVYDFDDSIVIDKDLQFQQDMRLVNAGLMSKVEFRMRNFGEDEATAKKKIADVQAEQPKETDLFAGA